MIAIITHGLSHTQTAMIINEFTNGFNRIEWVGADTETHTYIDGKLVSENELLELGKIHNTSWFREHAVVHTYAWLISDGRHFAWFETFEEFCEFCAQHKVSAVWWYNAKFDFSAIDYHMLKNGWEEQRRGRLSHMRFNSLHGGQGQRYSLKIGYEYRNRDRHKYVHTTAHYDLCNILGGGLAQILENFNVTDFDGNPIRKLDMDYQADTITQERIDYMKNDTHGLYHAVRIASDFIAENFGGLKIAGKRPDIITAGGLAKKIMLRHVYKGDDKYNVKKYQWEHLSSLGTDWYYRHHRLYAGGKTFLNPRYANRLLLGNLYKYDENSMYPDKIKNMPDLIGSPRRVSADEYEKTKSDKSRVYIVEIKTWSATVKKQMLGMWYDFRKCEYVDNIEYGFRDETTLLMFADEWEELKHWYDFQVVELKSAIYFDYHKNDGYAEFVDTYFSMKAVARIEHVKIREIFAKLVLNSSYGKFSQNPHHPRTHREINPITDAVILIDDNIMDIDEGGLLSVVQGALVTSMARVDLMQTIRKATHNNPRDLFVYCDTDSMVLYCEYSETDSVKLGAYKDECNGVPFTFGKFLAPKTYVMGRADTLFNVSNFEVHTKGIQTKVIQKELDGKKVNEIDTIFSVGAKFQTLCGLNISGGKALIPLEKFLCKDDNSIKATDDTDEYLIMEV